ncbi:exosporium protein CsxC [Clostridium sporogenes]
MMSMDEMRGNYDSNSYKSGNCDCHKDCGKVIESKTLPLCDGTDITPETVAPPVVAKIPVVIAEQEIQVDVEARMKLKEKYYEIKRIRKDVFLTQCELLPRAGVIEDGVPVTGKLFISGYVKKNIEYATADCVKHDAVSGDIKHTTEKIPFNCVTEVTYITPPIVSNRGIQQRTDLYCDEGLCDCSCREEKLGKLNCQEYLEDVVNYVEKPYCELMGARIFETDIQRKPCYEDGVKVYDELLEKMVVYVRVKVLQLQQVAIDNGTGGFGCRSKEH